MVATDRGFAPRHDDVGAFFRVRPVAHHIAQAEDGVVPAVVDVLQHLGQSFEVAVDVGDDGIPIRPADSWTGPDCS